MRIVLLIFYKKLAQKCGKFCRWALPLLNGRFLHHQLFLYRGILFFFRGPRHSVGSYRFRLRRSTSLKTSGVSSLFSSNRHRLSSSFSFWTETSLFGGSFVFHFYFDDRFSFGFRATFSSFIRGFVVSFFLR